MCAKNRSVKACMVNLGTKHTLTLFRHVARPRCNQHSQRTRCISLGMEIVELLKSKCLSFKNKTNTITFICTDELADDTILWIYLNRLSCEL